MATELNIKLLIDKNSGKVLFAEAGKDVIDFIFTFLALPVGAVIRLLSHTNMPGCLGNLYNSVRSLNDSYINNSDGKSFLLQPKLASLPQGCDKPLLLEYDVPTSSQFYKCNNRNCSNYFSDLCGTPCGGCNVEMVTPIIYVAPRTVKSASDGEGGFVKGVVSYMIMDDLAVSPMSTVSSIALLTKFSVKDLSSLEERVVQMGKAEALALLKISFQSKTVLTDVFLKGKRI